MHIKRVVGIACFLFLQAANTSPLKLDNSAQDVRLLQVPKPLTDLRGIEKRLDGIRQFVLQYKGDRDSLPAFNERLQDLEFDIEQADEDTQASAVFDTALVPEFMRQLLEIELDSLKTIDALDDKKALFVTAGDRDPILGFFQKALDDFKELLLAFETKIPQRGLEIEFEGDFYDYIFSRGTNIFKA